MILPSFSSNRQLTQHLSSGADNDADCVTTCDASSIWISIHSETEIDSKQDSDKGNAKGTVLYSVCILRLLGRTNNLHCLALPGAGFCFHELLFFVTRCFLDWHIVCPLVEPCLASRTALRIRRSREPLMAALHAPALHDECLELFYVHEI